ncbi:hypothetical protein KP509_04G046400 [Ceratopteris richardii]|uniref:Two-component response regulator n=1 Tax=Ceratopteris richardii TaxID=49495 RepID=A0A8T2UWN1_CERRI|nr:hypothetical protein KP509_04G046400 [Ceratopteris richardii]
MCRQHVERTVTTCARVAEALELLRRHAGTFDLVMSDVYMPDADGFKLLETVGLEMDLPVIMMSVNGETSVVMKGITHGACDYFVKPIRMEELKTIWQHVARRKGNQDFQSSDGPEAQADTGSADDEDANLDVMSEDSDISGYSHGTLSHDQYGLTLEDMKDATSTAKDVQVKWSAALHEKFLLAVNELGVDKASPRKIMKHMNVPGLTKEHVASHLQKYRIALTRLSGAPTQQSSHDHKETGSKMRPRRKSTSAPMCTDSTANALLRSSTVDSGWLDTVVQHDDRSVTEQKITANRAQVLGSLGLKSTSDYKILQNKSSQKGGTLHRSSVSASLANTKSGMESSNEGGGLFRMGSLDIGLLLKLQEEEDEMDQLQKNANRDSMDDITPKLASMTRRTMKPTSAKGQQIKPRSGRPVAGAGSGRMMIPMAASGQMQQQPLPTQRRAGGVPSNFSAAPSSNDMNLNLCGNSVQMDKPGMQGHSRYAGDDSSMEQVFPMSRHGDEYTQMDSPSSSYSSPPSNKNISSDALSRPSQVSLMSYDSFSESPGSYNEATSFFQKRISPR